MAAVKALQQWCRIQCEGYRDVAITNMTTSFRDGLAFCALLHKHRPDLIDFDSLSKENVYENNHLAFRVAEEELGIPALLDAEDMVALKVPDRLSILTYVSQYYNYFHGRNPIGGMAGIKRPADESNEERPGKRNQPVTAKVLGPPKAEPESKRDVLVERSNKSGTLSSICSACSKHVHLVQRHLVDGKLYHRNCFRCSECSNILLSGTYKPGKESNTFVCKTHTNAQKPPAAQAAQVPQPSHGSKATPAIRITPSAPTDQNTRPPAAAGSGKESTPYKPSPLWSGKIGGSSSPTPTPRSKPPTARSEALGITAKSPQDPKQSPKAPNRTVLKNQEARQRFFESSTGPGSTASITKIGTANPFNDNTSAKTAPSGGAGVGGGAGRGRVLLRPADWAMDKDKEKENEKEKAKSVISKLVIEDTNKSSSLPWRSSGLKTTNSISNVSPVDTGSKGPSGRTRLKPLEADLDRSTTPTSTKTSSWLRNKDKDSSNAVTTPLTSNKEAETAPSDWRSMLKPVAKDAKSGTPKTIVPASAQVTPVTPPAAPSSRSVEASGPAPSFLSPVSPSSERPRSPVASPRKNGTASSGKDSKIGSSPLPAGSPSEETTPKQSKLNPNFIPKEEIMQELKDIERSLDELEKQGVELEKQLRLSEEEGEEDTLMNDLMVDWFSLIRNKQVYMRRESELVYIAKTQDLEEEQPNVEAELRKLLDKPDHLKTPRDRRREEELMAKLVEIVNDRNAIVDGLDEDRLREEEEDEQLNKMMQNLDIKKEKKKKSAISKLFGWKSKAEATGS
ncbi:protein-methionine sulfoxide oxidase mical2b isoform X2 [Salminus brasiliensis]|uniref:protein-methionine sulfoxide oxidase mical2b isoform X2 n=1 Tax=Salminus brasiliensis TaxID=930266 RepID=UPI003B8337A4